MHFIDDIETAFIPIAARKEVGVANSQETKFTPTIALLPVR